ncbi:hypothetical protein [Bilophila wadsworthia]|uniref:hypothetical protein n=1 Tax=Bilophila wadsworthia TaxID=35833 RepID=UPI00307D638A
MPPRRGSAEGRVGAVHLAASSHPRRGLRQGHCGSPDASRQRGGRFLNGRFAVGAGEPAGQATGAAE